MKLSFSLSSKPQTTIKKPSSAAATATATGVADAGEQESREFVTQFDASRAPSTNGQNNRIIPPKVNEWRPHKKMKNIDLPLQSEGQEPTLQFEVVPASSTDPASSDSMSYGLNLRNSESNSKSNPNPNPSTVPGTGVDPLLNKLRGDLKRLPDDGGLDDFEDMPVEGLGRALLAGYGWTEGRGIGRNAKEDVKVVEYKRRTAKEGLGFTGELPQKVPPRDDARKKEPGGESDRERGAGGQAASNGKEKSSYYAGKDVRIVGGNKIGMKGRILEVKRGGEVAILRLSRSEEEVKVHIRDLAELGSVEEERCLSKLKELRIREKNSRDTYREIDEETLSSRRESRDNGGGDGGMRDRKQKSKRGREEIKGNDSQKLPSWLTNHIRVRIISKQIKGGRLYLQKGEIVDVVGPTTCDVAMDGSNELIQAIDQEELETAIPKRGGPVLVLYGEHKGAYGSLVKRDTETETGVVRDADTHELLNVRLEQIAEYIGYPSYLGY